MSIHKYATPTGATRYRVMWRDDTNKQRSKTVTTLAEARRLDAATKLGKEPSVPGRGPTMEEWLVSWFRSYSGEWSVTTLIQRKQLCDRWVLKQLGHARVSGITRRTMLDYRNLLQDGGATDKTINKAVSVISAALSAAVNEGHLEVNPCRGMGKLKVAPTKRRALEAIDVERIRHWMPTDRDRLIVSLLAYAGLRPGELVALHGRHLTEHHILVEQSAQRGMIKQTKTGRGRYVPLNPVLAEDLAAYGTIAPDELVVSGERGGILHWKNWFRRVWVPAAKNAGVDATPYDLRHTFVSLLLHSGATIPETALAAGHTPTVMLTVYAHVYADAQRSTRLSVEQAIRDARTQLAANRPAAPVAASA